MQALGCNSCITVLSVNQLSVLMIVLIFSHTASAYPLNKFGGGGGLELLCPSVRVSVCALSKRDYLNSWTFRSQTWYGGAALWRGVPCRILGCCLCQVCVLDWTGLFRCCCFGVGVVLCVGTVGLKFTCMAVVNTNLWTASASQWVISFNSLVISFHSLITW